MNKLIAVLLALLPACTLYLSEPESDGPTSEPFDGWRIWQPEDRQPDPRAEDPSHVYLEQGLDGVALPLPWRLILQDEDQVPGIYGPEVAIELDGGIAITVLGRQMFWIEIADFADQLSVARVELWDDAGELSGRVILVADGAGGVARDLMIHSTDGNGAPSTGPWTIEVR